MTRRSLLAPAAAAALAVAAPTGLVGANAAPARGSTHQSYAGGADEEVSRDLARKILLVSDDEQRDLKPDYLKILIDRRLPAPTAPKRVLVVGAGVAGLTAATLLLASGHEVVVIEANANRVGGRVKTFRGIFADKQLHAEAGAMRPPDFSPWCSPWRTSWASTRQAAV